LRNCAREPKARNRSERATDCNNKIADHKNPDASSRIRSYQL
jgi:hypothetical protein